MKRLLFYFVCFYFFKSVAMEQSLPKELTSLQEQLTTLQHSLSEFQESVQKQIKPLFVITNNAMLTKKLNQLIEGFNISSPQTYTLENIRERVKMFLSIADNFLEIKPDNVDEVVFLLTDMLHAYFSKPASLSWCDCFPSGARFTLNLLILQRLSETVSDPFHEIISTFFASGELLQEYLLLRLLLKAGYKNLQAIIIDTIYPDYPQMTQYEKEMAYEQEMLSKEYQNKSHQKYLKNKQNIVNILDSFQAALESAQSPGSTIHVTTYNSMETYMDQLKKLRTQEVSDAQQVFVMADPNLPSGYLKLNYTNYPSFANLAKIVVEPDILFYLFADSRGEFKLFENNKDFYIQSKLKPDIINSLKSIKKPGTFPEGSLSTVQAKLLYKQNKEGNWVKKNQYKTVEFKFLIDPHLAFQQLIKQIARPNALIFTLYDHNPLLRGKDKKQVQQEQRNVYIKKNLINAQAGQYIQSTGFVNVPR